MNTPLPTEALVKMIREEASWLSRKEKDRIIKALHDEMEYIEVRRSDGEKMWYFPLGKGMWRISMSNEHQ